MQYAKWAHAGQKISKSNPHIYWQTSDDHSSILANRKHCKGCRSASSASVWLPLRVGVSGGGDMVTLILWLANIRVRKLVQLPKSFMLWDIWLPFSWILVLLLNTNIGIKFCYMLSAGDVIESRIAKKLNWKQPVSSLQKCNFLPPRKTFQSTRVQINKEPTVQTRGKIWALRNAANQAEFASRFTPCA